MITITEEKVINLTLPEFAFLVKREVSTIRRHIYSGRVESYQPGGKGTCHIIPSSELAKYGIKLIKDEEFI